MKRSLQTAALVLIAFAGLIAFKTGFVSLDDFFSTPFELAVEVKPLRGEPNSKYGRITITNLSKETVTIRHVSINRSTQPTSSFDPKDAGYETPVLKPGRGMTVATVATEAGFCGLIFVVTIDTDRDQPNTTSIGDSSIGHRIRVLPAIIIVRIRARIATS
jgi:hypothetical protein